ncbi:MAG: sugar phosphate isomerase/epimerase family protein [Clostridia bacterium]
MKGSIHNFMQVSIVHFMAYPFTMQGEGAIAETVRRILIDDYFDAIELSWIKDPQEKNMVIEMLRSSHITVAYGAQPRLLLTGMNINDLDEEKRLAAVASLKEGILEAYEMGASSFAFLSGRYEENKIEEAFQALLTSTKELCRFSRERGDMKIVLEVFDHRIDKKSLIGPAHLAARFAREMRKEYENFGLMVDLSHLPLLAESAREAILPVKDYIVHAHIGNCVVKGADLPAYGDMHPRFGFPNGENDVEELVEFLRVLRDIGFLNEQNPPIVSFEVKPFQDEDTEIVIANAKRTLNRAWARV